VPAVRHAKAEVKGSLDKDIIRRIVRAHINEVRHCYNKLLVKEPTAEGKVTVSFTIDATGKVSVSSVTDNTTGNDDVAECIAKAVKRWTFPRPTGGGVVTVSYPFVLSPGA
jgi:TonB family protein